MQVFLFYALKFSLFLFICRLLLASKNLCTTFYRIRQVGADANCPFLCVFLAPRIRRLSVAETTSLYRVAQKSKPLPNYQKIVLNRIKVCQ